jgi:hypothetical protein
MTLAFAPATLRDDWLQIAGRELAERSCVAQGIPVKLPRAELDRLAPLFRPQPVPSRPRRPA